jgi:hypothetical protein
MRKTAYSEGTQTLKDKVINALYNTLSNIGLSSLADMFKTIITFGVWDTNINWSLGQVFIITLIGAKTITESNLHIGVKDYEVIGDHTLNVPSYWKKMDGSADYDGSVLNLIQVKCTNSTSGSERVWYYITKQAT